MKLTNTTITYFLSAHIYKDTAPASSSAFNKSNPIKSTIMQALMQCECVSGGGGGDTNNIIILSNPPTPTTPSPSWLEIQYQLAPCWQ